MVSGGSAVEEGSTRLLYRSRLPISAGMKIIALALLLLEALQCAQAMVLPSVSSSKREEKRSIEVRASGLPFDVEGFTSIFSAEKMKEMCKSFKLGESSKPESKRSADPASPYGSLPWDPSKLTEWCDEIDKVYPAGGSHKEETRSIQVRASGLPFDVEGFTSIFSAEKMKEMCKSFKLGESSKPESKRSADPASPYGSLPWDPSKLTEWCDEIDKVYPAGGSHKEETRSIQVRASGLPFDVEGFTSIFSAEKMKEMCKSFKLGESSKPESKRSADPASPYGSLPWDPSKLTEWCDEIDKVYPAGGSHKEETRSIQVRASGLPFDVEGFTSIFSAEKMKEMCKSFKLGESSKPESKRSADPASPYGSLPWDPSKLTEWCDEIDKVYPAGGSHKEETRSIQVRASGLPFDVEGFTSIFSAEKMKEMCKSFKLGESSKPESKRSADPASPYGSLPWDPSKLTEWCDEIDKVYPAGGSHKEETRSIQVRASGLPFDVEGFTSIFSAEKMKEMCKSFKLGESSKPESKRSADPASPYGSLPWDPSKLTEWCDEIDKVYPAGGSHKEETRSIQVRASGLPFDVEGFTSIFSAEKMKEMCKSFKLGESSKPESKRSADPASPYGSLPWDPSKLTEWCNEIDKVYPAGGSHKEETRSIQVRASGLPFDVEGFTSIFSAEKMKEMCKSFKLGESSKPESKRSADPASPYGSLPWDPSKLTEWCDEIDKVYPAGGSHKEETRSIQVRASGLPFDVEGFTSIFSAEKMKEMCKSFKLGESSKPESKRSADPASPYGSLPWDPSKLTEWCDEIDKVYPAGGSHKEETRSIQVRASGLPFDMEAFSTIINVEKMKEMCKSFKLGESSKPESKRSADPASPYGSLPWDPSKLTEWCDEIDKVYTAGGSHKEETRSIEVRASGLPFDMEAFSTIINVEKMKEMCKSFKLGESSKPESKRSADPASPFGSLPWDPSKLTEWCDEIDKVYPAGGSHKEETRSIQVRASGLPFDMEAFSTIINVEKMKEMCKSFKLGESSKPESKRSADPASPYGSLPWDPSKLTKWCDEIDKVYPAGGSHKEETRSIQVRASGLPFDVEGVPN